jgi:hypothetical protein
MKNPLGVPKERIRIKSVFRIKLPAGLTRATPLVIETFALRRTPTEYI